MLDTISNVGLQLLVAILIGFVLFIAESRVLAGQSEKINSKATTTGDLARLVDGLNRSSNELDSILAEIIQVAQRRGEATARLQAEITKLEQSEEEYLVRIETLKNEPVRVINDLLNEVSPRQIRSPRRDFMFFAAGVVVSTIVSIVLSLLRLGG